MRRKNGNEGEKERRETYKEEMERRKRRESSGKTGKGKKEDALPESQNEERTNSHVWEHSLLGSAKARNSTRMCWQIWETGT